MGDEQASKGLEDIAASLVRRAARRAPAGLAARLEEEWLADLAMRRRPLARMRLALGCTWASQVIAFEHARPLAASAGGGSFSMSSFRDDAGSRRAPLFLVVLVLHAAAIYALLVVRETYLKPAEHHIENVPLPDTRPQPPPVSPPEAPHTTRTIIELPPLTETQVMREPESSGDVITGETPRTVPVGPPASPPVIRHAGGPGNGFPSSEDYYPSASIFQHETGAATVRVCVNGNGRLTMAPDLQESSGFARLDGAALKLARDASGRYRPTTENGRPVTDCYPLRIRFQMRN